VPAELEVKNNGKAIAILGTDRCVAANKMLVPTDFCRLHYKVFRFTLSANGKIEVEDEDTPMS
jgi:hypothetical protein